MLQESIKKFKDETQKLEDSDALKQARKKFVSFVNILFLHQYFLFHILIVENGATLMFVFISYKILYY